jgi:hypothetical protein
MPKERGAAEIMEETARRLREQSKMLRKQADDLIREARWIHEASRKARELQKEKGK